MSNDSINAIRITSALPDGTDLSPEMMDEIASAGAALNRIEDSPGYDWEKQHTDWDSVCHRIASHIVSGARSVDWFVWLQKDGRLRVRPAKRDIVVFINQTDGNYSIALPKELADGYDVSFEDADEPDHAGYRGRGLEHPAAFLERLRIDPDYEVIEHTE